jgi:hypothetical protein
MAWNIVIKGSSRGHSAPSTRPATVPHPALVAFRHRRSLSALHVADLRHPHPSPHAHHLGAYAGVLSVLSRPPGWTAGHLRDPLQPCRVFWNTQNPSWPACCTEAVYRRHATSSPLSQRPYFHYHVRSCRCSTLLTGVPAACQRPYPYLTCTQDCLAALACASLPRRAVGCSRGEACGVLPKRYRCGCSCNIGIVISICFELWKVCRRRVVVFTQTCLQSPGTCLRFSEQHVTAL